MNIGIDIMGGDYAPANTLAGAFLALEELDLSRDKLFFFGDKEAIRSAFKKENISFNNTEIIHTPDVIEMGEQPTRALISKPRSAIALGYMMLKNGDIDVFSSAGNTGAMLVGALSTIKTIPGVLRPCTSTILPQKNGGSGLLLDIGTVPDCKPENLFQFAIIGNVYAKHVYKIKQPRVALLNIGEEEEKGNLLYNNAYKLMKKANSFNFIGNIEGRDLFSGKADVIVSDGHTGNIVLKEAESFYHLLITDNPNNEFLKRFNYEIYGGMPLLGVNAPVLIGHGISNPTAIKNMILHSRQVRSVNLTRNIKEAFEEQMFQKNTVST